MQAASSCYRSTLCRVIWLRLSVKKSYGQFVWVEIFQAKWEHFLLFPEDCHNFFNVENYHVRYISYVLGNFEIFKKKA